MQVTRRYWGVAATSLLLAALAVAFARPLLLVGAASLGAWLLGRQYLFVRTLSETVNTMTIEQFPAQDRVVAGTETPVTLAASFARPVPLVIDIEIGLPVSATGTDAEERTLDITPGDERADRTVTAHWAVAGSYELPQPTLTLGDADGLFVEQLSRGPTPSIVIEPQGPRNVHVGEGGEQLMAAYGQRQSGRRDVGLDPGELREYVPGDTADRIDWNATARLNEPHVREYEIETNRTTALLVDHRATMADGPTGETKLDYARQVALTFIDNVDEFDDPLAYYAVGDSGITERRPPTAGRYDDVKRRLRALEPTAGDTVAPERDDPATKRHTQLSGRSSFEATLAPYLESTSTYVERIEGDPLFETARTSLAGVSGTVWTVIFTDDSNRAELRETVSLARRGDGRVLVFLTPTALFEPGGLVDLETAYERYRQFESFRRDLARLRRVSAFEIGPRDRLDAVLASGSQRSRSANAR
ncbi:DUF58 domain-containing protein [Halococcus salifodinae]|uniref:DUF58 domain-containing protein n=1 Tax=Halococcus salifodinae DSM 8989 TaxID=1227456 RepID=M0N954_9EURY|nr:DUF58 domain-containing protein [Halococcus salifodinae]EMA53629.1 hypothetical protein C450_06957 [Halococcus salifodinae DSM 8989]